MKAVGICLPLVCSPDISSLLPPFFFFQCTFTEFSTEETWPQMVLGGGGGRPRAPESSSVMGPGLGYLHESLCRGGGGGGYHSAHRAGPQAGTQAGVQGVTKDPIPTLNRCGRGLGWGSRTH